MALELIDRDRKRRKRWYVQRTEAEVLLYLEDDRGRTVFSMTAENARRIAGALNSAAQDLMRAEVMRRGTIVGPVGAGRA